MPVAAEIYYSIHADSSGDQRPPVVLIHGAGGTHLFWPSEVRRLAGYRVYSLDLPGHGKSGGRGLQTISAYRQAVCAWLEAVGLHSAVFVGHSMGSAIALTLALDDPEHVLGLGLIGASARLRVAVEHVHAWIAGSRGSPVPLWSSATVAGIPLSDWRVMGHGRLTVRDRVDLLQNAVTDASDADDSLLAVCGAILSAENRVLSVASSLTNVHAEIDGAWLSWPTIVNDAGAETPLPMKLNDAERAALRAQVAARHE